MKPIHWLIVLIVLLIVFGASKLPDIAHSIGKSAKVLKEDLKDLQDDPPAGTPSAPQAAPQPGFPQAPQQPQPGAAQAGPGATPAGTGTPSSPSGADAGQAPDDGAQGPAVQPDTPHNWQ
ncbi:MAG: twin-arginine translocase TatA/TatE family subunit [Actinomyces sp.]|jgi:sec-independent protein translocase protein TatA|nr:twin-arginine translocase TatA/TatE family subunit [Actinomyces sp.]MCI1788756.1 twin-arginine translocase TatA/TatE family subunit [Actinomyces sp.]MCI1831143.1 twin-arginine translocase TatA/TatE family subunit [Actinomyces sp.]